MLNKLSNTLTANFAISILFTIYSQLSQAGVCPGLDHSAPAFPQISRVEIANPQAPSRPHPANPGSNNDARALMAFQGETIDLMFTMAEPIPAGCTYQLSIFRSAARPAANDGGLTPIRQRPAEALDYPFRLYQSELTVGDNLIKFKIDPAPQLGQDKVYTLYASFQNLENEYISNGMPFKFKNLAYKILNITKEPYSHSDQQYSVDGVTLKIALNAMPTHSATDGRFGISYLQVAPLAGSPDKVSKAIPKNLNSPSSITTRSALPSSLSNLSGNLKKLPADKEMDNALSYNLQPYDWKIVSSEVPAINNCFVQTTGRTNSTVGANAINIPLTVKENDFCYGKQYSFEVYTTTTPSMGAQTLFDKTVMFTLPQIVRPLVPQNNVPKVTAPVGVRVNGN
jgi:hypothetical protein